MPWAPRRGRDRDAEKIVGTLLVCFMGEIRQDVRDEGLSSLI